MDWNFGWNKLSREERSLRLIAGLALAVWLGAALTVVRGAAAYRRLPAILADRAAEAELLSGMRARAQGWKRATAGAAARAAVTDRTAFDWTEQSRALGVEFESAGNVTRQNAAAGFTAARVRLDAPDAPLAALSPLLESAEGARPPWRLTALTVEAQAGRAGRGRVAMELENLEAASR